MKFVFVSIFCISFLVNGTMEFSCTDVKRAVVHGVMQEYIKNIGRNYYTYYNAIFKFSDKYNIDPEIIARQIGAESSYRYWLAKDDGSVGCAQVKPKHWALLLYRVDNGRLAKKIKESKVINPLKYFTNINYNIEMQCYIVSNYMYKYNSVQWGLIAYRYGDNSEQKKYYRKHPLKIIDNGYLKKIIGE